MDTRADDGADGVWMTYAELGKARRISKESALKLALRHKWRKQADNRGHVRVYVPIEWATPRDMGADAGAAPSTAAGVDMSRIASAFEVAVTALTQRTEAAEAGRREAETALAAEREARQAQAAEVEAAADELRQRVGAAEADAARERERAAVAERRVAQVRADVVHLSDRAAAEAAARVVAERAAEDLRQQIAAKDAEAEAQRRAEEERRARPWFRRIRLRRRGE